MNDMTAIVSKLSRAQPTSDRVAVVDIGSNSIRLVVFDGFQRTFFPLFNEKVICGLGRGISESGKLSKDGMRLAVANLLRFTAMARAMNVGELHMVATAAMREAENGPDFMTEVQERCGHPMTIISGAEEARLAALGVLAGTPNADGVMGDLGGGSLELVGLHEGALGDSQTLPLGPLRMMDDSKGGTNRMIERIDQCLAELPWLEMARDRVFYAVGGAWRNLARIHMDQTGYPLHVLHGYTLHRRTAEDLSRLVARLGSRSLAKIPSISRRRADVLPYAALLLSRVLRHCRPSRVMISAYGLREGFLYDRLATVEKNKDPLRVAASDLAEREGRFGGNCEVFAEWFAPLFPDETPDQRRLREVACLLSDLAWREHPDYRAVQAMHRVLLYPFAAIDHAERAFIAYAVYTRYGGSNDPSDAEPALALLSAESAARARLVGMALRLAYTLSAGVPFLLRKTELRLKDGKLRVKLPDDGSIPSGEVVERRLEALVEATLAKNGRVIE